jgi:hypothetical protein
LHGGMLFKSGETSLMHIAAFVQLLSNNKVYAPQWFYAYNKEHKGNKNKIIGTLLLFLHHKTNFSLDPSPSVSCEITIPISFPVLGGYAEKMVA